MGQRSAGQNENHSGDRQRNLRMEASPGMSPRLEPAFRFALIVIDTVSETRVKASPANPC